VPIIIIAGNLRGETDHVVGLELGANDYITKPFGLWGLLARIRAMLRRDDLASQRDAVSGGVPIRWLAGRSAYAVHVIRRLRESSMTALQQLSLEAWSKISLSSSGPDTLHRV
jgi:DNA-binding response OmpR family regulator